MAWSVECQQQKFTVTNYVTYVNDMRTETVQAYARIRPPKKIPRFADDLKSFEVGDRNTVGSTRDRAGQHIYIILLYFFASAL